MYDFIDYVRALFFSDKLALAYTNCQNKFR